jgi:hypothetical protein
MYGSVCQGAMLCGGAGFLSSWRGHRFFGWPSSSSDCAPDLGCAAENDAEMVACMVGT